MIEALHSSVSSKLRIVGRGLLANAFARLSAPEATTVFASGVSNSGETHQAAFSREEALLRTELAVPAGCFVYFSTCSIRDDDRAATPYTVHKMRMEALVRAHTGHLILRLPQVVGQTANPHTLTNFLAAKLAQGEHFQIWTKARRCLVDVEHVTTMTMHLIALRHLAVTRDIAPPETISMLQLVALMESVTGCPAHYTQQERGGGSVPDASLMCDLAPTLGIDVSPGYASRVIRKYYGRDAA